jgi:acetyltransferase
MSFKRFVELKLPPGILISDINIIQLQAMPKIEQLSEEQARAVLPQLVRLLQDTVNNGSSVGFLPPLASETAQAYWLETAQEVAQGKRLLLVASEGGEVVGTVQLALVMKENGLHRAEVQKLLVDTRFRRRGIAGALMNAVEMAALEAGRTLLVLDTEEGSTAESLYERCGYTRSGVIPRYARNAAGSFISTVVFYRLLSSFAEP